MTPVLSFAFKRLALGVEAFLRLLYPAFCARCRQFLTLSERAVCSRCRARLRRLQLPAGEARRVFERGLIREYLFLYAYKDELKELWGQVKFGRKSWLTAVLCRPLGKFLLAVRPETRYDYLIPVPTTLLRRLERHYNQAEILAQEVSAGCGIPVLKALKKKRSTPPQKGLSRIKRLGNLRGSLAPAFLSQLRGKSVLVVDDVFTTGTTLRESARVLKKAGARTVGVFALAKTPAWVKDLSLPQKQGLGQTDENA